MWIDKMHTKYKEPIYPSQHSSNYLTIPQIEITGNGAQIKERFKSSFHKAPKILWYIKHLVTQYFDQTPWEYSNVISQVALLESQK